ncbi:MAG: hypothetical protein O2784_00355 [Proteobacteria bacterium]|nr:hypothetical protein [Pseudomonadota bacterium]
MKEAGMRIRVEPELREEFTEACKRQHVPAAQFLREYMREFVKSQPKVRKPKSKSVTA